MRSGWKFLPSCVLLISACDGSHDTPRQPVDEKTALMERIESSITLPDGANELGSYSRNYALEIGIVRAHFIRPEYLEPKQTATRRWFDNSRDLPSILDGGCAMVAVIYNLRTKRFDLVRCNGVA